MEETEFKDWWVLGHDIENKGDFPVKENLILSSFCNDGENVLTIDNTSVDNSEVFSKEVLAHCLFVAHNADHEASWGVRTNFLPARYACTMVNSKRLLSGQEGYRFDLVSEISRRLGPKAIPEWMNKDIRSQFSDHDGTLTDDQVLYNAADTIRLKQLLAEQIRQAVIQNQLFLNNTINSRLIIPIAEAEMYGIRHNAERWSEIARDRKTKADEICKELDGLVVQQYQINPEEINPTLKKEREKKERKENKLEVRITKLQTQLKRLEDANKTHLKSYLKQKEQLEKLLTTPQESVQEESGIINWGSQPQVLKFLNKVGVPLPQAKDKKTREFKPSVGKEARANWFVNNQDSPFYPVMEKFDKYKKLIHNVNSFGEKWIVQYTNPITGRVHTKLDQAGTDTGRFSSGSKGKNKKYPNMQQIPSPPEYRGCFGDGEGRTIITLDYANCEGVVMTSLSGDMNMKQIIQMKDSHSYLGTKSWREIYKYRYKKTSDPKWLELSQNYEMNKSTPEKDKERTVFKNSGGLFPVAK